VEAFVSTHSGIPLFLSGTVSSVWQKAIRRNPKTPQGFSFIPFGAKWMVSVEITARIAVTFCHFNVTKKVISKRKKGLIWIDGA